MSVDLGRNTDGEVSTERKVGQSGSTAGIVFLSQRKQALDGKGDLSPVVAVWVVSSRHDVFGRHVADPRSRQVASSHLGVFHNVSGDVGELHGDAKVNGMKFGPRVAVVEDFTHQETHRSSHFVGVLNQGRFVLQQNARCLIVHQPLDQGSDDFGGEVVFADHAGMMSEQGVLIPAAFAEGSLDVLQMPGSVGNIAVRHVVKHPAKGVENRCVLTHFFPEEATSPVETLTAGGEDVFGVVGDLFSYQSQHLRQNVTF